MEPFVIDLLPELKEPGDTLERTGNLPLASYMVGGNTYQLPQGVDYDIILTHTGEGVLLTGMARAQAQGECSRCLDPAKFNIAGEIEGYYLFEEPDPEFEMEDDEYELISDENTVDISGPLEAALVFETPFVLLCKEDCKGLCPTCGANLNREKCTCSKDPADDPMNPFAVLKNLKLEDDAENKDSEGK